MMSMRPVDDLPAARLLGRNVARLRDERGWSQPELAERMNDIPFQSVSRLERGISNPTLRTIAAAADALGVEIPDLFREA